MTIQEFITSMEDELQDFKLMWLANADSNSKEWPLDLSKELWEEQFLSFFEKD
tara:strand:+ start:32 stop:190 length:159 start_codon:yes stop_codon:yes gene_type:complete